MLLQMTCTLDKMHACLLVEARGHARLQERVRRAPQDDHGNRRARRPPARAHAGLRGAVKPELANVSFHRRGRGSRPS